MARISPVPMNTPEEDDGVKMPQKLMTRTLNLKTQILRMPMRLLSSNALARQISEKDSHMNKISTLEDSTCLQGDDLPNRVMIKIRKQRCRLVVSNVGLYMFAPTARLSAVMAVKCNA